MRMLKLITAYIRGSKLDRMTIRAKLLKRVVKKNDYEHGSVFKFKNLIDISKMESLKVIEDDIYEHYIKHEYNFLGTGWVNWNDDSAASFADYKRIAWNKDICSGFVFHDLTNDSEFVKKTPQGTDIKIPWELARMQYWPQLALYGLNHMDKRKEIQIEFKYQMLDFMDCNPVGKGIHFFCAMEIAIRAINLMVSYDIISQYESMAFDEEFTNRFEEYIYFHLDSIINRLEKNYFTGHTGNHYLTDLCGMLWICMYYKSVLTKKIFKSVVKELRKETEKQFTDSGSNFECSTGYHLLATEILGLALFAIAKIDSGEIRDEDIKQLCKLKQVINVFKARDNRIVQIGDNDSGRILKLNPLYSGEKEDCLDPCEVKSLLDFLIEHRINNTYSLLLDSFEIWKLMRAGTNQLNEFCVGNIDCARGNNENNLTFEQSQRLKINIGKLMLIEYIEDFGLVKVSCELADIYIRTVPKYENMDTSHAHDDVFSFQIITDNNRICEDLGSIVYTSDKEKREYFASARSHRVPIHSIPMVKRLNTFETSTKAIGSVLIKGCSIAVEAEWEGIVHRRKFEINPEEIYVIDSSTEEFRLKKIRDEYYSLGYGQLYER